MIVLTDVSAWFLDLQPTLFPSHWYWLSYLISTDFSLKVLITNYRYFSFIFNKEMYSYALSVATFIALRPLH